MELTEACLTFAQFEDFLNLPEGVNVVAVNELQAPLGGVVSVRIASEYFPANIANNGDPTMIGEAYAQGIEEKLSEPPSNKGEMRGASVPDGSEEQT
jgi:hypothetical protein